MTRHIIVAVETMPAGLGWWWTDSFPDKELMYNIYMLHSVGV